MTLNSSQMYNAVVKNVYNQTKIFVKIRCEPKSNSDPKPYVQIGWVLRETMCWNEYAFLDSQMDLFPTYYNKPEVRLDLPGYSNHTNYARLNQTQHQCDNVITLPEVGPTHRLKRDAELEKPVAMTGNDPPQYIVEHDGNYLFVVHIEGSNFEATVDVDMMGPYGYLSIVDWPLLPFYGLMCGLYVAMGLGWLVVCSMHWRDLLRIQFWIGAVIFLGMLEKALFLCRISKY